MCIYDLALTYNVTESINQESRAICRTCPSNGYLLCICDPTVNMASLGTLLPPQNLSTFTTLLLLADGVYVSQALHLYHSLVNFP